MTDVQWESLSNWAVAACGVVYFLALLVHLAEWASLRKVPVAAGAAAVASVDIPGGVAVMTGPEGQEDGQVRRTEFLGRLGYLLTVLAVAVHLVGLVGRGMAADPDRVPWGNMYEFTLTGTFVVAALYVGLYHRFRLAWMAPIVVAFVLRLRCAFVTDQLPSTYSNVYPGAAAPMQLVGYVPTSLADVAVVGIDAVPDALTAIQDGAMTATVSSDGPWQGGIGLAIGYCVATGELSVDDITDRAWFAEQFLIQQDNVADFVSPTVDASEYECDNVFSRSQGPIS